MSYFNSDEYEDNGFGLIKKEKREKISPFLIENLNRSYNIERFPKRIRREPKILKRYGIIGNACIVMAYREVVALRYSKGSLKKTANKLSKIINISEKSLQTKISQLRLYLGEGYDEQISYGLKKTYKQFKDIPLKKLKKVFYQSKDYTDKEIEERLNKLLTDPTFLNDEEDNYKLMNSIADEFNRNKSFNSPYSFDDEKIDYDGLAAIAEKFNREKYGTNS
jgi:hypothetical protein